MRFEQTTLRAFEDQPITLVFNNLHPDLHNVVLLDQDVDVDLHLICGVQGIVD